MASINLEYIPEPKLQFAEYFDHEDTKTGLAEYGPFGRNIAGLHAPEIKLGFIGTRETIANSKEWIQKCASLIESQNITLIRPEESKQPSNIQELFPGFLPTIPTIRRLQKILNRDFVGFNMDSPFHSCFVLNSRWERHIDPRELELVLSMENKTHRIYQLVDLFQERLVSIAQSDPPPDIVIIALTQEIEDKAHSVRISGNFHLNLRRAIKAKAMDQKTPLPIQLLRQRTLKGAGDVQEVATRAWNFCTAQYYKAGGIPWRPSSLESDTCYVGVSFYVAQEVDASLSIRSSVAQAFDYMGQGLVLRGDEFHWDAESLGPSPHLTRDAAKKLITQALNEYVQLRGVPPRRVVIHKTSEFWGSDRGEYDEEHGFYEGIDSVFPKTETDFVALRQTGLRLFREGQYPPLRGTYFTIEDKHHFLYTMGFIPYLETYPKPYVPEPWQITQHIGGRSPKELCREILSLTKMNVNNCAFADGTPITLSFAQKVGEIMKHIPPGSPIQSSYKFYM